MGGYTRLTRRRCSFQFLPWVEWKWLLQLKCNTHIMSATQDVHIEQTHSLHYNTLPITSHMVQAASLSVQPHLMEADLTVAKRELIQLPLHLTLAAQGQKYRYKRTKIIFKFLSLPYPYRPASLLRHLLSVGLMTTV